MANVKPKPPARTGGLGRSGLSAAVGGEPFGEVGAQGLADEVGRAHLALLGELGKGFDLRGIHADPDQVVEAGFAPEGLFFHGGCFVATNRPPSKLILRPD